MRSSTRPSFFALVIGLWIISCAIVFVSFLVTPPARGQEAGRTGWSPTGAQPLESDGEVVLTFTKTEPGRITYRTMDGDCSTHPPWVPDPGQPDPPQTPYCGRPRAQAPEDYGHVSGEMVFTEAGSRTIRISIVDDDLDEVNEPFGVRAAEGDGVHEQMWLYTAGVTIIDDDPKGTSDSATSPGQSNRQIAGPQTGSPTRPVPPPATTSLSSGPTDAGNQAGVMNPGDPILAVEGSVGEAKPSAADTVRDDNFILMAGLRALLLVAIAAAGFALKKRFGRKTT